MSSRFITRAKTVGRFEFIQNNFQLWKSSSTNCCSLESLSTVDSDLLCFSTGYSSCSSGIVSVTNTAESSRPSTPLVNKFVNIAKEGRVHSSLDDLFSNLLIKIGNFFFYLLIFLFIFLRPKSKDLKLKVYLW